MTVVWGMIGNTYHISIIGDTYHIILWVTGHGTRLSVCSMIGNTYHIIIKGMVRDCQ